jgi:F-type H+-transporting ATPase subunit b
MHVISAYLFNIFLFISNEPTGKKDTLLSVEPGLMIWTILIFIILVIILKKYAWGPLLKSLHDREKGIKDSVDKAENMKLEAERILEENKKLLAKADEDARKVLNESKQLAEKLRAELMSKANEDAQKAITQARAEIEREKVSALNELKDEIANLAVQAAGKIIDENLDANKQKKIIDQFISQIPKN